jgi:hypothetical protein
VVGLKILKDTFRPEMARIKREIAALRGLTVHVGIMGDAGGDLLMIAGVHEYGATIHAKNVKHLAIPLTAEAKDAGSPRSFSDLEFIPISPGYGYLVREKPEAKGKAYDPDNYDWLYMLVESVEIPERSFIRASFDNGGDTLEKLCKEAVDGIIRKGWTAQEAADYVGKWAVEMTREYFNTKLSPAKSVTTLRTTTQYQPLFDSGRLYNSITYRVEGGGAQ